MKQENWYDVDSLRNKDYAMSTAFPALMRKVFVWMTLALAITGLTAYGVATSPTILSLIFSSKVTFFGLIIAEFALVFAISGAINRLSLSTATMLFILYSVINGATLSSIFFAFSVATISKVFFITAGTFGAMALVGYTTKTDLTSMGKLLFMALLGIIIASVVNMFVASSGLDLILSYVGVLVFVGLTAYDTQKIKQMCQAAPDASESSQKLALIGALSLYLDFINLFLYLLRIFGNNRD
ncbi:Bax inhibitor-1/YccA family protein [Prevotella sp.]|uniref:Bax inhibitor-1/YccA family protein n=1 Tax=uncultured Prevotella sp. TaxID=159272 RepID=UPI0025E87009|nr:Bax inhibitor-1/YccA family protein [Prevotella sp.]MCI6129825.1 Bax inhibitor-1/YccA family protein [Prevotella sp.]MCI7371817.1 Bax inhibitor-1/YccA family protein [Prevotella sp.]